MTKRYRTTVSTTSGSTGLHAGAILAGIGLAASFFYVRAKTRQAQAENPPEGKFIEVDGVRLHYLERGSGPTLVLLHGNGVYTKDFETSGLLQRASERYRVIAFDRPGFGYSERPRTTVWTPDKQAALLHQALGQLGVESAIVAGHSWGTMVALAMGLQQPDFVRGLVLLSGYYYPSIRLDAATMTQPAIPLIGDLLRYTISPLFSRLIWPGMTKRMFAPAPVAEGFKAFPTWMALRPSQLRASAAETALMIPSALSLSKRYAELKVPAVMVAGTQDKIVDAGHNSERLHERLPNSELALEPGVGHMTHYADPGKVMAAIDAIAARVGEPVHARTPEAEALARASESGV
ncbi:alpha/beta fold hydrolase [Massilia yuzhufengensis]|uniref:Pimeloyl-ACP methyl ester carboxylesterase n=1 Tax=Massilia yuzhufengensis TaxID=1164594 RepID=A0A1I1R5Q7_9BURK|nr:alpha/beta hydrolase [Massilia yuzhufengensis]SFD26893.1 Pimeloyl-ACP methyl ester carboxylesterase [Massilia yuzhufengensis]